MNYKLLKFSQFLLLVYDENEVFVLYHTTWVKITNYFDWNFNDYRLRLYKLTPMTVSYNQHIDPEGELLTREDYIKKVETGLISSNGYGYGLAAKDGTQCSSWQRHIHPREIEILPTDCTHVVWFNG